MGRKNRDKIRRSQQKQKQKKQYHADTNTTVNTKDCKNTTITGKPAIITQAKVFKPPCHIGFCEVYPHLFVGKESDLNREILSKIDVLVPLNDLLGRIWDMGYRNDIMYVPISDFSTLPQDVEEMYVEKITNLVKDEKNVAIFCLGGHGRTGYIASLVLYNLGYKNPIHHLKTVYCDKVIESYDQLDAVAMYCDNEDLLELYDKTVYGGGSLYDDLWGKGYSSKLYTPTSIEKSSAISTPYTDKFFDDDDWITARSTGDKDRINYMHTIEKIFTNVDETEDTVTEAYAELICKETCGNCAEEEDGFCALCQIMVDKNDASCLDFSNKA